MSDEEGDLEFSTKKNELNYKIILVGDPEVGKTSIITRYHENSFSEERNITVNKAYFEKQYLMPGSEKIVKLHVWDTLG